MLLASALLSCHVECKIIKCAYLDSGQRAMLSSSCLGRVEFVLELFSDRVTALALVFGPDAIIFTHTEYLGYLSSLYLY